MMTLKKDFVKALIGYMILILSLMLLFMNCAVRPKSQFNDKLKMKNTSHGVVYKAQDKWIRQHTRVY